MKRMREREREDEGCVKERNDGGGRREARV